jgi:hypothetical protein
MKVCVDPGHGMSNSTPGVFDSGATHTENGTGRFLEEIAPAGIKKFDSSGASQMKSA